jgi:sarcosine oxidase
VLTWMAMDRRTFLRVTGAQAGALAAAPAVLGAQLEAQATAAPAAPAIGQRRPHVVVVGAGAWGGWTAYWLRAHGAQVTLVDAYGPGNSRASSGDDTRGIRTAYGERELWSRMAAEAIRRWNEWDAEWAKPLNQRHFFTTGDLILRPEMDNFLTETRAVWDRIGTPYEVLTPDEIRYRFPQIEIGELGVGVYEPGAGVARARRCCESVAEIVQRMGGELRIAHASLGARAGNRLNDVVLAPGDRLAADAFVFACGVWLPKVLPEAMAGKMRASLGHVYYFGTPAGESRFTYPNMPSWNVGGTTGWPALGQDNRGFRVRFGGRAGDDPDASERAIDSALFAGAREFLNRWFPAMGDAPIVETRACHYDGSINRNFIVDRHPGLDNVWVVGAGQAEGFKMGPVIGEYAARRVLDLETEPELAEQFALPEERYEQ